MRTMLNRLTTLLILSIALITLSEAVFATSQITSNSNQQLQTVILSIPTMTCGTCPITIKTALKKVKGVNLVEVNFQDKTAKVTFNSNKTKVADLVNATKNAGYPSKLMPKQ